MTCLSPLHRSATLHCVTWQADKKGHDAAAQWDVKPEKFKPCCCLKKKKKQTQSSKGGMLHADIQYCWILHSLKGLLGSARLPSCLIINHANLSFCFCMFYPVAPHSLEFLQNPWQSFAEILQPWSALWHGDLSSRSALLCIWDCCMHKQGLLKEHGDNVTCCKSQFKTCEGF